MDEFQLMPKTKEENNSDKNKSKDIICNICKENCFIEIKDYTFNLSQTAQSHLNHHYLYRLNSGLK